MEAPQIIKPLPLLLVMCQNWMQDFPADDTAGFGCRTWRNQARTQLEPPSMLAGFAAGRTATNDLTGLHTPRATLSNCEVGLPTGTTVAVTTLSAASSLPTRCEACRRSVTPGSVSRDRKLGLGSHKL